nr:ATP-binding protein [Streptomyces sp. SID5468]
MELEALPHRIGQVRRIVSAQLRYWGLESLLDTTLLGITELLANVHRHAQPDKRCAVELVHEQGRLTVSVADNDPRPPRAGLRTDAMATCGRGLAMLAALSDEWGTRPNKSGEGKIVWFTLSEPASGAPDLLAPVPPAVALPLRTPLAIAPCPQPVAV